MDRGPGPRPVPGRDLEDLPKEIATELQQVAHFGKAGLTKDLIAAAAKAYEEGSYAQALTLANQAKQHAPRSATVREMLGLAYYRLGRWREAARELAAYRRMSDRRDEDHIYADCERALGRPEKALEILQGLTPSEVGPEVYVEALVVAAGALMDLNRHEQAVEVLKRGPVDPEPVLEYHLRLWYVLAEALEGSGRRAEARDWWDAIYAEDPDFFDVADRRLGLGGRA
ncbi:MAG TPA: tetratricopeptide repeat protein [Actinomycetota bacterium]|nr:tetratricopeptide repeat protein [Actinomycetota bacterium]